MADTFPIEKMADENPSKTLNSSSESEPRSKKKVQDVLT